MIKIVEILLIIVHFLILEKNPCGCGRALRHRLRFRKPGSNSDNFDSQFENSDFKKFKASSVLFKLLKLANFGRILQKFGLLK
uniref:Uncharacterized protein n=1 Tax=Romanomermis culicivorax TaxID=13658 RepID=A0A915J8S1_ROMCU